jgi:hypothetical protein
LIGFSFAKIAWARSSYFAVAPRLGEQLPKEEQQRRSSGD